MSENREGWDSFAAAMAFARSLWGLHGPHVVLVEPPAGVRYDPEKVINQVCAERDRYREALQAIAEGRLCSETCTAYIEAHAALGIKP